MVAQFLHYCNAVLIAGHWKAVTLAQTAQGTVYAVAGDTKRAR